MKLLLGMLSTISLGIAISAPLSFSAVEKNYKVRFEATAYFELHYTAVPALVCLPRVGHQCPRSQPYYSIKLVNARGSYLNNRAFSAEFLYTAASSKIGESVKPAVIRLGQTDVTDGARVRVVGQVNSYKHRVRRLNSVSDVEVLPTIEPYRGD